MATEKATDTTATQNPAAPGPQTPARARAPRAKAAAKASTAAPDAALIEASASVAVSARKSPRARAKKSRPADATAASGASGAEVLSESTSVLKSALLKESSKSLAQPDPVGKPACKAHCGQCGREMRFVPFALSNLMCRSCYGLDRYRRPTSPSLSSLTAPRPSGPR